MSEPEVLFHQRNGVGVIYLNAEHSGNAITARMAAVLRDLGSSINHDPSAKVIVLTGTGRSFSVGTAADEIVSVRSRDLSLEEVAAATSVASITTPVIAAVNGDAVGQGLELVLACDVIVAAESASFAMPHVLSGSLPWDGGTQRLSRLIGEDRALELILTGRSMDAEEACRAGLASLVLPDSQLVPAVVDMAERIALKAPIALRYAKEAVCKGLDLTLTQGLRLEGDLYYLLQTTSDRTEGIRSFQEKRQPQFEGD